jgi:DNA invertase Pin-like site-specific DNA recombinase
MHLPTTTAAATPVGDRLTARGIVASTMPLLVDVLRAWHSTLPPEAAATWRRGAVYIRESTLSSGVGNSPEMQLRNTLLLLAAKKVWVPEAGIFFDVASGASLSGRVAFQRLFEEALAGGYEVIGVFGPDRLFRNQTDALTIRRAFREHGIQLEYLGKFEGDSKDAAAYQLDAIVDMQSHVHAHMASQNVGRHFEALSRSGRPVSGNPEVYVPCGWAPSFLDRPGSIIKWEPQQPLADIIKEGCRRFLNGATLPEVARWSATTALGGVTPAGHPTDITWWRQTLLNPKYAGFQHPTVWPGFKPTEAEKRKAREESRAQLVRCILPSLWDLDAYNKIVATLKARWHGPKDRTSYQAYLLSGVAFDERCGHGIAVTKARGPDGHYWMSCSQRTVRGRTARHLRTDVAELELNEIVAGIRFDDPDLIAQIEIELTRLIGATATTTETLRPNPEIAALRQAVAALERVASDTSGVQRELLARIEQLQALDEAHRDLLARPVVQFRAAMGHLAEWARVWAEADMKTRNKRLREAGVKVWLDKLPGQERKPAHVRRIESENPVLALALVAGLATFNSRYVDQRPLWSTSVEILIALGENAPLPALAIGLPAGAHGLTVSLPGRRGMPLEAEAGPWWTPVEVAARLGRSPAYVRAHIMGGDIGATKLDRGGRHWLWVNDSELRRLLAKPAGRGPVRLHFGKASSAMATWLRDALAVCPVGRVALARRAGVTTDTLSSIAKGRHAASKDVAAKVARALLALTPSPSGEALLAAELANSSRARLELDGTACHPARAA